MAGLDARGRPILVRRAFGREGEGPAAVLAHPSETAEYLLDARLLTWGVRVEVVHFVTCDTVSRVSWIEHDSAARPIAFATIGEGRDGPGLYPELSWCEWDGERCSLVRTLRSYGPDIWDAELLTAEYDEAGLLRVRMDDSERADTPEAALSGLEQPSWRGTTWRRELDAAEEEPLPLDVALEVWTRAAANAAARAVAAAPPADPWVIKVIARFDVGEVPSVEIADSSYRDAIAGRVDAREAIWRGSLPRLDLLPHLDEEGHHAWRSLRQLQPYLHGPEAAEQLQRHLAAMKWPNDALALSFGLNDHDHWDPIERVLGPRLDSVLTATPAREPLQTIDASPASREELVELLRDFALPEALAEQASWGVALMPGGSGLSQLGGAARLPEDMAWPTCGGRALTHLASIALSELPDFEGRVQLPADGTLAFFADLTDEGELWDGASGADERVRILHIPAGAPTHEPAPPADERAAHDPPTLLRERRIRFEPVLTLPQDLWGLSTADELAYERLYYALWELTPGLDSPSHLMLGNPSVVQEDPREPGEVSLLHMGSDEELGFDFLDLGDITFYGDPDDVRAGRWERLTVSTQSC
jgi:hypothetical protein